jgi:hypothetical protein
MTRQLATSGCPPPRPPPSAKTMRMGGILNFIRIALALFLLAAAGLKAHGIATDPLAQDSLLVSPRVLVATIEIEVVLALWLLSGYGARGAWLASFGFFAILASVSLYLGLVGQASCGCFGRITVSPWWTLALDMGVIASLVACRPQTSERVQTFWFPGALPIALGAGAIVGLAGGAFLLAFDDPAAALARLRGEPITVEPSLSEVGDGIAQEQRAITIELKNHGTRPVRVVGGTANCACIATGHLPISIAPHESRPISVKMTFKGESGRFQRSFALYTDDKNQPVVVARFAGRVIPPDSP